MQPIWLRRISQADRLAKHGMHDSHFVATCSTPIGRLKLSLTALLSVTSVGQKPLGPLGHVPAVKSTIQGSNIGRPGLLALVGENCASFGGSTSHLHTMCNTARNATTVAATVKCGSVQAGRLNAPTENGSGRIQSGPAALYIWVCCRPTK
jgi:hypothetical protein